MVTSPACSTRYALIMLLLPIRWMPGAIFMMRCSFRQDDGRPTGRPSSCRKEHLIMKIAPGIHRIGNNSMINAYLVEQAGEVTIIDAGVSGFYKDIDGELAAMGRTPGDVKALILTHGHNDHIGFAE